MDVIIVSKTHMSNAACVGGVLADGRFVRLLNSNGYNQDSDTDIEVGEVYTISFSKRKDKTPPHIEDILVHVMIYKFTFTGIDKMVEYLKTKLKVKIWEGSTDVLFDGNLQWTSGGSGYISESGGIPNNSVGFWIPDKDLKRNDFNEKVRYSYPLKWRNISYVGFQSPIDLIPAAHCLEYHWRGGGLQMMTKKSVIYNFQVGINCLSHQAPRMAEMTMTTCLGKEKRPLTTPCRNGMFNKRKVFRNRPLPALQTFILPFLNNTSNRE